MGFMQTNMNLTIWHYIGIAIIILDIVWIGFYYYYATVKIYNYHEKGTFQYLGYLWIRKKNGQYYLKIPQEMIENSVTTKYKITSESVFHQLRKEKKLYINFADNYDTEVIIEAQITVKNYIATSHQL